MNLLLHVGPPRPDGLHEICSLFASVDLADEVIVSESAAGADKVVCPGVEGPNICTAALRAFRAAADESGAPSLPPAGEQSASSRTAAGEQSAPSRAVADDRSAPSRPPALPAVEVRIEKRIPVAAGLGGGSADAAAVLRAANKLGGQPLARRALHDVAAGVGADVPSQLEPRHALVQGAGEIVEPIDLPPMCLVLVPSPEGLSTPAVYREADRIGATREALEPEAVRALAGAPLRSLAASLENDLQAAALSLRPELTEEIAALNEAGALVALVTGSGPTVFGLFEDETRARPAAARLPGAVVAPVV